MQGVLIGLFIVSVIPTTLSSSVVMTGTTGGNMARVLFVTILSNFMSVVSVPLTLSFLLTFLRQERMVTIDQIAIIIKLFCLVLVPFQISIILKKDVLPIAEIQKENLQTIN
jgi:solute carrier family 10 (sodium/bile acid cotransporter), member 7